MDDVVANDDIQQKLMVLPRKPTALAFVSLLSKKPLRHRQSCTASEDLPDLPYATKVRKLVEGGIDLKDVNVGNMLSRKGKSKSAVKFMSMTRISGLTFY